MTSSDHPQEERESAEQQTRAVVETTLEETSPSLKKKKSKKPKKSKTSSSTSKRHHKEENGDEVGELTESMKKKKKNKKMKKKRSRTSVDGEFKIKKKMQEGEEEEEPTEQPKHNSSSSSVDEKHQTKNSSNKNNSKSMGFSTKETEEMTDVAASMSLSSDDNKAPSSSTSGRGGTSWWTVDPPAEDAMHLNSILQNQSKRVARCPCTYFWGALIISLAFSFIGLIVGEFSVSAETGGWISRGTLVADRHTQSMMTITFQNYLFYGGEEAWEDLINNVQPGWDSGDEDEEDDRRLMRRLHDLPSIRLSPFMLDWMTLPESNSLALAPKGLKEQQQQHGQTQRLLPFAMKPNLHRKLQEEQDSSTGVFDGCDLSFYQPTNMTSEARLWPVWKVNDGRSALDPDVLRDICVAEQATQDYLQQEGLCGGCDDGRCLPPYSIIFYARLAISGGFSMDCDTLAEAWAPLQATVEESWGECVTTLKETYDPNNVDLPERCGFGWYPTLVQVDFEETLKTQYTSSIFATTADMVDDLYLAVDTYDRGTSLVNGAYDTQYEDFVGICLDDSLGRDMALALGSAVMVSTAIMIHTRSPLITGVGLLQIVLSFPLSYFVYKLVAGLDFFPFLNFIGIFVVFALGAGDIFVAVDKWKNARISYPEHSYSTEFVAAMALPDAAYAMWLTTITTAVAFFSTAICPVAPIKMFATFCGLLILFDYIMNVLLVFPALCIYDKAMLSREKRDGRTACCNSCWMCCVSWRSCCRLCSSRSAHQPNNDDLEEDRYHRRSPTASAFIHSESKEFELTQEEEQEAMAHASFTQRVMLSFYHLLHCVRWPLFVVCLVIFGICVWIASTLALPVSSDVRLLNSNHVFEKAFAWRQHLLSEQLEKLGGSVAYSIWGVRPADTGDQNNPASWSQLVLDETFDPSSEESQIYLRGICDDLFAQDFAAPIDNDYVCPMTKFDEWLLEQSIYDFPDQGYVEHCAGVSGLPVAQESFDACISYWATLSNETSILSRNGIVKIIFIPFNSRVRFDSQFDVLHDEWNLIEDWFTVKNHDAPEGVNKGYFSSYEFWWYDTNGQMLSTAYSAAAMSLGCAAAVILLSSRSLVLTLFSTVTIGYVLTSVTAMLVAIGWTLGFLESICFAILIGVSVDFVIHFAHAYAHKKGEIPRGDRTKYALVKMGPSIFATAITTILSAVVMLFTVITFFQKFALILFFTIVQASIGSYIVFLTFADCLGPTNPTYLADKCVATYCQRNGDGNKAWSATRNESQL